MEARATSHKIDSLTTFLDSTAFRTKRFVTEGYADRKAVLTLTHPPMHPFRLQALILALTGQPCLAHVFSVDRDGDAIGAYHDLARLPVDNPPVTNVRSWSPGYCQLVLAYDMGDGEVTVTLEHSPDLLPLSHAVISTAFVILTGSTNILWSY